MPDQVVLQCALAVGTTLDRPLLRELRREIHAAEALTAASRALARRDMSRRRLAARLQRAGVAPQPSLGAISALTAAGALDDERLARRRAAALSDRGWGDAAIAARLESEGIDRSDAQAAIDALASEPERAAGAVAGLQDKRQAWTLLARRGFDANAIEAVLGPLDDDPGGGLR